MLGPTILRVVGQQCCVRLHGPLETNIAVLLQRDLNAAFLNVTYFSIGV